MSIIARFENLKVQSCSHPRCRVACDSETHYIVCEHCKLETQVPCNHTKGELKSNFDASIAALDAQLGEVTAERDSAREALKKGTDRLLPFEKECYVLREQLGVVRDAATQAEQDYQRCREALKISDAALEEFRTEHRAHLAERAALRAEIERLGNAAQVFTGFKDIRVMWANGEVCETCSHTLCTYVRSLREDLRACVEALGYCAIPLEALAATEVPGQVLCKEIQDAIVKAVIHIRSVVYRTTGRAKGE